MVRSHAAASFAECATKAVQLARRIAARSSNEFTVITSTERFGLPARTR
jgi:hypothetical protein